MEELAGSGIDEFLNKADKVSQLIQSLQEGKITPEEFEIQSHKLTLAQRAKEMRTEEQQEKAKQARLLPKESKGDGGDYAWYCRVCSLVYLDGFNGRAAPNQFSTSPFPKSEKSSQPITEQENIFLCEPSYDKAKIPTPEPVLEKDRAHCIKCGNIMMTRDERHQQLRSLVEDLKDQKANRKQRRNRWEMYQKTHSLQSSKAWRGGKPIPYDRWAQWEPSDNSSEDEGVILPKNDAQFKALEKEMESNFRKRRERFTASVQHKEKGNNFFKQGILVDALKEYDESLTFVKDNPSVWTNKALVENKLGLYKECIESCSKAIELCEIFQDMESPVAVDTLYKGYMRRGDAKKKLELFEDALKDFETAHSLLPKESDPIKMKEICRLAIGVEKQNEGGNKEKPIETRGDSEQKIVELTEEEVALREKAKEKPTWREAFNRLIQVVKEGQDGLRKSMRRHCEKTHPQLQWVNIATNPLSNESNIFSQQSQQYLAMLDNSRCTSCERTIEQNCKECEIIQQDISMVEAVIDSLNAINSIFCEGGKESGLKVEEMGSMRENARLLLDIGVNHNGLLKLAASLLSHYAWKDSEITVSFLNTSLISRLRMACLETLSLIRQDREGLETPFIEAASFYPHLLPSLCRLFLKGVEFLSSSDFKKSKKQLTMAASFYESETETTVSLLSYIFTTPKGRFLWGNIAERYLEAFFVSCIESQKFALKATDSRSYIALCSSIALSNAVLDEGTRERFASTPALLSSFFDVFGDIALALLLSAGSSSSLPFASERITNFLAVLQNTTSSNNTDWKLDRILSHFSSFCVEQCEAKEKGVHGKHNALVNLALLLFLKEDEVIMARTLNVLYRLLVCVIDAERLKGKAILPPYVLTIIEYAVRSVISNKRNAINTLLTIRKQSTTKNIDSTIASTVSIPLIDAAVRTFCLLAQKKNYIEKLHQNLKYERSQDTKTLDDASAHIFDMMHQAEKQDNIVFQDIIKFFVSLTQILAPVSYIKAEDTRQGLSTLTANTCVLVQMLFTYCESRNFDPVWFYDAIAPLIEIVRKERVLVQKNAVPALASLAKNDKYRETVRSLGGIDSLAKIGTALLKQ